MRIFNSLKKRFTLLLLPHSTRRPVRFSVSIFFITSIFLAWLGALVWAVKIISKQINYWEALDANQKLNAKVEFFAREVSKARDYVDHLKPLEVKLKVLLGLRNQKDIIELSGMGGVSFQQDSLLHILQQGINVDKEKLALEVSEIQKEAWERKTDFKEITGDISYKQKLLLATPSIWPAWGWLTSGFGWRQSPFTERPEFHKGIDIAGPWGKSVRVSADGIVIVAGWQGGLGRSIIIDHGHGYTTRYCHLSKYGVKIGQKVKRGEIIGYMGSSGRVTASHLHYEVRRYGKAVNPLGYIKR